MMNRTRWYSPLSYSALCQECGENLAIFCYFICWDAFVFLRSRKLVSFLMIERPKPACWNPSSTFSTRSTIPTALGN